MDKIAGNWGWIWKTSQRNDERFRYNLSFPKFCIIYYVDICFGLLQNPYAYGSSGGDPSEASGAITAEHARFFPRSDVDSSLNLNE